MKKHLYSLALSVFALGANAQNPYMPLWEHIPDGEPYVFEDPDRPGEMRVYVYGSHDNLKQYYCGHDQVVWSASVSDLTDWRYDGVIFRSTHGKDGRPLNGDMKPDVLYAPDIVETEENGRKVYYLCPNTQNHGRNNMVAKAYRPDGPFEVCNWSNDNPAATYGVFGFDPAIFRDDDGRVYGYWGFGRSHAAELDPKTMCSEKPGTKVIEDLIPGFEQDDTFRFFEASSMRKIGGKYVLVYSRMTRNGESGLPASNYTLAYAYSNNPLGPFTYGGTIIDGRARGTDEQGNIIPTANPDGNTHGSLQEINGKWYVFYHRQTGTNEFSRQAMVAPVDVKVEGGKVIISEAEYTSEGFCTEGLNPLHRTPAGLACYYTGPSPVGKKYPDYFFSGSYIKATYADDDASDASYSQNKPFSYMVNNTDGSIVGYKYFNFSKLGKADTATLSVHLKPLGVNGDVQVMIDSPWTSKGGKIIGSFHIDKASPQRNTEIPVAINGLKGLKGKHALFFIFKSATKEKSLCDFYDFVFNVN